MKIFLAYSPEDELLKTELEEHLSLLQKKNLISVWNASKIAAGEDISLKIAEQIRAAQIILLLISSDFLASDILEHPDIKSALAQQQKRSDTLRVIPVVLRDCVWRVGELAHLKPLPNNGYAATNTKYWNTQDEALKHIAVGLQKIVADLSNTPYDYPSGTLTGDLGNTVSNLSTSFWQRYKRIIGSGTMVMLITLVALYMGFKYLYNYGKPILSEYQYNEKLEGTWVHAQYFQNMLFVAKLVFRDGKVEVYSKDNGRELYWGKQPITIKDQAIAVEYQEWNVTFQIEPQFEDNTNNIKSLVTIYRLNDAVSGINVVNDTLIRPLVAAKNHATEMNNRGLLPTIIPTPPKVDTNTTTPTPTASRTTTKPSNNSRNTTSNIAGSGNNSAAKDSNITAKPNSNDTILERKTPILQAVLNKLNDSTALQMYNIMPVETLQASPTKRIDWLDYTKKRKKDKQ